MNESTLDSTQALETLRQALGLTRDETPFPWQVDLLRRFLDGSIPSALDVPTGLGKTSVIAIWLVARAVSARVPRRLVYVVDRRAVVDQSTTVAEQLREFVQGNQALRFSLGLPGERSLPISTLRGQFIDNKEWLEDPSVPAIVLGTVDMIGSRLLFSGYGVSRRMRPYHAGLLGTDSLIVLDEAHLVPPFERLIEQIATGTDADGRPLRPTGKLDAFVPRLRCLSLSATGRGRSEEEVLSLSNADREHPVAKKRLAARKRLIVRNEVPEKELPETLANETWKLCGDGTRPVRLVVFCTSRDCAQKVQGELKALSGKANREVDVDLFVGGRRVYEREQAAEWLRTHGFIAGSDVTLERPAIVIATAAGEVGVDFDANHCVCDIAPWERMVQRFGRVNRRGDGEAQVTVVPTSRSAKAEDSLSKYERWRTWLDATTAIDTRGGLPEEDVGGADAESGDDESDGKAPKLKIEDRRLAERTLRDEATRELISHLQSIAEGYDVSPSGLLNLRDRAQTDPALAELFQRATTPAPLHPPLTRPLLEAWSMTSLEEHAGRPAVDPWIRGWPDEEEEPQTTVVWRTFLPLTDTGQLLGKQDLEAFRDAADPHLIERLETETWRVVDWLIKRAKTLKAPVEKEEDAPDSVVRPLGNKDPLAVLLDPSDGRARVIHASNTTKEDREDLERGLRNAILIVDRRFGGLKSGLLDDETDEDVVDVTEVENVRRVPFRVRRVTEESSDASGDEWRKEALIPVAQSEEGPVAWLLVESLISQIAESEDGRSGARNAQFLEEHQEWTELEARRIASQLGLPEDFTAVLTTAARLHDEGKKAERWQRAFNAPGEPAYAKTTSRPNLKLLEGYRHELGSLPYAEANERVRQLAPELRDLCLHVIATHHGNGRPTIRTTGASEPPSRLVERAQEVALRFAALEKRWGPWGLAWWEALLRAADQQASRRNDLRGESHG